MLQLGRAMTSTPSSTEEPHYGGEDIIAADGFLRRLPNVLDSAQRLRLDALTFSADALHHSWCTLQEVAVSIGTNIDSMTTRRRAALFGAVWSIVDHLHVVRQLTQGMVPQGAEVGPLTTKLLEVTEPASLLRNKMDHLGANLRNLASKQGQRNAVFGTLSYFVADGPPLTGGTAIVVQTGMLHGKESWRVVNPAGAQFQPPVDLFELSAFDLVLKLGPAIAHYVAWLRASEKDWEDQINSQVAALPAELGTLQEDLMVHGGAGFTIAVDIAFDEAVRGGAS
jgi:hypothetical protein